MLSQIIVDRYLASQHSNDLSTPTRFVLMALAQRMGKERYCFPSHAYLAAYTGLSRRSIVNSINHLVAHSIIKVEENVGKPSRYFLTSDFLNKESDVLLDQSSSTVCAKYEQTIRVKQNIFHHTYPQITALKFNKVCTSFTPWLKSDMSVIPNLCTWCIPWCTCDQSSPTYLYKNLSGYARGAQGVCTWCTRNNSINKNTIPTSSQLSCTKVEQDGLDAGVDKDINLINNVEVSKLTKHISERHPGAANKKSSISQLDSDSFSLPDFISLELWQAFVVHRKKVKAPLSSYAAKLILKKLTKWQDQGYSAQQILETSIEQGWKGVFEPRQSNFSNSYNGKPEPKCTVKFYEPTAEDSAPVDRASAE